MIDRSATEAAVRRHHLTTFGTLGLSGPDNEPVLGVHGHHRRRLALLAVLAAAGERGRSRDQLLLLFWPEATQSRARHSLDQLLYALRGSIHDSVFAGVNPVRLNADVVASDVDAFNAALERDDLQSAVETYRGPFLDGFYLTDAPEFERWVETERARLASSRAGALERLARGAEAAGDVEKASRWWHALTEADPLSSRIAAGRIRALVKAGDQAAALQYARRYEALVEQELGTSVDPAITALVDELRRGARNASAARADEPPPIARAETVGEADGEMPPASTSPELPPVEAKSHGPATPRPAPRRRRAFAFIAATTVLVVAATALWRSRDDTATAAIGPRTATIAVLPFANVGGAQQDAALVNGLNEELISVLAKLGQLRVIARGSASAFRLDDAAAHRMADSVDVSHVLHGSVQRAGPRVRVQVRLVDARDGSTRWAETYDRELQDVFAVQSDIASAVARELDLRLGAGTLARIRRPLTSNVAAYEFYLRGNDPTLTRSDSGARAGLEYFQRAVALDPGFAAAHAGLARMYLRAAGNDDTVIPFRARLTLANASALRAVALDDSLADAHAALSLVRKFDLDIASSETELKRAIALDPMNARLREWLVQLYVMTERPALALVEARRAVELDPLSPTATAELAYALQANERCDEALAILAPLRSLRPPLLRAGNITAQCYARKGMWVEAEAEARRISANGGLRARSQLAYVLARRGQTAEAERILAALIAASRERGGNAFEVAMVYAGLGDNDRAFEWIDRAVEERSVSMDHQYELLRSLRSDPRYDRLRERFGIQKR